jgi:hypothetical protein
LRDDGAGSLVGIGSGNIFYNTKSISLSLAALPDVGSAIVISYANRVGVEYVDFLGFQPKLHFVKKLATNVFDTATLTITYTDTSDVVRVITCDGNGVLGGAGVGRYSKESGVVAAVPSFTVKPTANVVFAYSERVEVTANLGNPARNGSGNIAVTLPNTNIIPGSLIIEYDVSVPVDSETAVGIPATTISNSTLVPTGKDISTTNYNTAKAVQTQNFGWGIADTSRSYNAPNTAISGLGITGRGVQATY